jgi:hypothetical protein
MFNKNPNITIKKMVEIADSIGLDISIIPTDLKNETSKKAKEIYTFVLVTPGAYKQEKVTYDDVLPISNTGEYITAQCSNLTQYRMKEYLN